MHLKKIVLSLFSLTFFLFSFAQNATITGRIIDKNTVDPIAKIKVTIAKEDAKTTTALDGTFKLENIAFGKKQLVFSNQEGLTYKMFVEVDAATIELGDILISKNEEMSMMNPEDLIPTISLDESSESNLGGDNIAGILTASRDVFFSTAAFTFGTYRFRIRGYDSENTNVTMNNIGMNDLEGGRPLFFQWGGLNDVMRNRDITIGMGAADYAMGGVGGVNNIDSRAGSQYEQFRVSYSASNRTYFHRLMASYSSGVKENGWAYSVAASRRWAKEGYVEGTFYDAFSYFASVEKFFGTKNRLSLTVFGAPSRRGTNSGTFQEVYDLMGNNLHNVNWGFQNGEKRNSRVSQTHIPTFILNNEWNINDKSTLTVAGSYAFGRNGRTAINWLDAPDPRPDYYRNLPSYEQDPFVSDMTADAFVSDPTLHQMNWDAFYQANSQSFETIDNVNGTGESQTINLSRYVLEDRRNDFKRANATILYNNNINDNISVHGGYNFNWQKINNYNLVVDLLGGEYFVDFNVFAIRDFPENDDARQNDLQRPNRLVQEGDRYGHDYNGTIINNALWGQGVFKYRKVDFFAAVNLSQTTFWRTGNVQNGIFPENSLGDSEKQNFFNYTVKAGATYKINGRNYLFANGQYGTRAPFFRNSFLSPRNRNELVPNLRNEEIMSFEGGYILRAPKVKGRAVLYYTEFKNQVETRTFFVEGSGVLGNLVLNDINKRHMGAELAVEVDLFKGLSVSPVAAIGQHTYSNRPNATVIRDNTSEIIFENRTTYLKNFFLDNGPQMAYTLGLNYRSPKYWFVTVNFNFFDRIYTGLDPLRRTLEAVETLDRNSEIFNNTIRQEQLPKQFTMDVFGGYSLKLDSKFKSLKRSQFLYFNAGISNLTNNTDFITGGFEQLRFTVEDTNRFPSRYFYNFGINFFASITYRL